VPIHELVVCGLSENKLLMQIYADVLVTHSGVPKQTPHQPRHARAVAAGKAAGGYDPIYDAAK
jgi:ribulose kinase